MSGKVTATDGEIGGFTIDADEIKSGTNIGLDSTNKKFTINNTTFGNDGIQLEYNGGNPRMYVGDGSNKFFKFDGTDVDIKTEKFRASGSSINLNSPSFRFGDTTNFISGSGGGLVIQNTGTTTISGSAVNIETPAFFMGATGSAFISGSNTKMQISSSKFQIKSSGDLIVRKVSATEGTIGGWDLSGTTLANGSNIVLDSTNKRISINNATFGGDGLQMEHTSGGAMSVMVQTNLSNLMELI